MTYDHIIDEQGVDHVKIDENQTYKFDFNPNNFNPTALKATLFDYCKAGDVYRQRQGRRL